MKLFFVLFTFFSLNFSLADNFTISPGSSISLGKHTVTCSGGTEEPEDRCGKYTSTDSKINTCSGRLRGARCVVGEFRGNCDLANEGFWDMCKCQ